MDKELESLNLWKKKCQEMIVFNTESLFKTGPDPTLLKWKNYWQDELATVQAKIDSFSTSTTPKATESSAKQGTSIRWLNRSTGQSEKRTTSFQSTTELWDTEPETDDLVNL